MKQIDFHTLSRLKALDLYGRIYTDLSDEECKEVAKSVRSIIDLDK